MAKKPSKSKTKTEAKKSAARKQLIITSSIYGALFIPALIFSPFVAFLYDSGPENIFLDVFSFAWFTFPVSLIIGIVASWILYTKNNYKIARLFSLFPLINVAIELLTGLFIFI